MEQQIVYVPVKEVTDPLLIKIEKTYVDSFPPEERRDFALIKDLILTDVFTAYALLCDSQYVGFITIWQLDDFTYVEHFAIDESARNGGIGGKVLKQFLTDWDKPIVLEVELPVEEMSKRRVGFYERLGFVLDHNEYQQPPYQVGGECLDMHLMSFGDIDLNTEFERIKRSLHQYVYGVEV